MQTWAKVWVCLGMLVLGTGCSGFRTYFRDSKLGDGPQRDSRRSVTLLALKGGTADGEAIGSRLGRGFAYWLPEYTQLERCVDASREPWGPAFKPWLERAFASPVHRPLAAREAAKRGKTDSVLVWKMHHIGWFGDINSTTYTQHGSGSTWTGTSVRHNSYAFFDYVLELYWYDSTGKLLWSAVNPYWTFDDAPVAYKILKAMGAHEIEDVLAYNIALVVSKDFPDEAGDLPQPETPESLREYQEAKQKFEKRR